MFKVFCILAVIGFSVQVCTVTGGTERDSDKVKVYLRKNLRLVRSFYLNLKLVVFEQGFLYTFKYEGPSAKYSNEIAFGNVHKGQKDKKPRYVLVDRQNKFPIRFLPEEYCDVDTIEEATFSKEITFKKKKKLQVI